MTAEEYKEKILYFMGSVNKHMENDAVFKETYLKVNVEKRLTGLESNQKWITRIGGACIASLITFFTRGYWMKH